MLQFLFLLVTSLIFGLCAKSLLLSSCVCYLVDDQRIPHWYRHKSLAQILQTWTETLPAPPPLQVDWHRMLDRRFNWLRFPGRSPLLPSGGIVSREVLYELLWRRIQIKAKERVEKARVLSVHVPQRDLEMPHALLGGRRRRWVASRIRLRVRALPQESVKRISGWPHFAFQVRCHHTKVGQDQLVCVKGQLYQPLTVRRGDVDELGICTKSDIAR